MTNFDADKKNLSTTLSLVDLDNQTAEQFSGGFNYKLNLYRGKNGTKGIVKSIDITEKSGYDIKNLDVYDDFRYGLGAASFSIDAEADGDGYEVKARTDHTYQSSIVDPNRVYNFSELNELGLRNITVNKVNTSYRSPVA